MTTDASWITGSEPGAMLSQDMIKKGSKGIFPGDIAYVCLLLTNAASRLHTILAVRDSHVAPSVHLLLPCGNARC